MDWKDIGGQLIRAGAPIIGGAIGGPIGGLIGSGLGNVLADALGVEPTPEAVGKAIETTPPEALTAKLSAAEAEAQAKWPALAEMVKAQEEGKTARFVAGTKDNEDARNLLSGLVRVGSPIQWAPVVISVIILTGYFVIFGVLVFGFAQGIKIDDAYERILIFMLGILQTLVVGVANYWLGSSAGSAQNSAALRDVAATATVAAAVSTPPPAAPKATARR